MHTEDLKDAGGGNHPEPARGGLRLVVLDDTPATDQRRRAPRRRLVAGCLVERRGPDRRRAKPGLDGLLRTVLADDWKPRVVKPAPVWGKLAAPPQHGADERKRSQP